MYMYMYIYIYDTYFMCNGMKHDFCYENWNSKSTLIDLAAMM
jgi:hypothetical protein